jgi:hypothetical protein
MKFIRRGFTRICTDKKIFVIPNRPPNGGEEPAFYRLAAIVILSED